MRIVVALGGNALLKRGELESADQLGANARTAARALAEVAKDGHELVVTHGNGPQIGLLALQAEAYSEAPPFPLDVLGAESEGLIGYLNPAGARQCLATPHVCDVADPSSGRCGGSGICDPDETDRAALRSRGGFAVGGGTWLDHGFRRRLSPARGSLANASENYRNRRDSRPCRRRYYGDCRRRWRHSPSPRTRTSIYMGSKPLSIRILLPSCWRRHSQRIALLLLTDVDAVSVGWGEPSSRAIRSATPWQLDEFAFDAGSMGPKVQAACNFVRETQAVAGIGAITDIRAILDSRAGTTIHARSEPLTFAA